MADLESLAFSIQFNAVYVEATACPDNRQDCPRVSVPRTCLFMERGVVGVQSRELRTPNYVFASLVPLRARPAG
jgi:hypothetical protein